MFFRKRNDLDNLKLRRLRERWDDLVRGMLCAKLGDEDDYDDCRSGESS